MVNDLANHLRSEGITKLHNVTQSDIQKYLEHKAESCSTKTMDTYRSYCKKLGECINVRYGTKVDFSVDPIYGARAKATDRGARDVISADDYSKLLGYAIKNPSASGLVVLLEVSLGGRVSDICRGITIKDGEAYMIGKGGKKYEPRHVKPQLMMQLYSGKYDKWVTKNDDGSMVFNFPKSDSVNKYLSRTETKLGIEKHSFHAIRRFIAQQKYDKAIESGQTKQEAIRSVSKWLNHGSNRQGVETFLKQHYLNI